MNRLVTARAHVLALFLALGLSALMAIPASAQVRLDLRDADLRSFVEIVAETTGRNYVLDPNVRGTVTILAPGTLTPDELYEVFLSVLELNRLTIIEGVGSDKIVAMNSAREMSPGSRLGVADGSYQTRVIELQNATPAEVTEVVRPLLPAEAVMSIVPGSNLIILSDRGQNHRRIEGLIKRLDKPSEKPIEMIRLRNANAAEVLQVVQAMNIVPEGASVTVDRRSNALVISGPDQLRQQVRALASRLDTQRNNTVSTAIGLNYAEAATLADIVLRSLQSENPQTEGQIHIVPEPQTNSLLITAPQDRIDDIQNMVKYLDRRPTQVLVEAVIFEMTVEGFSDLTAQFGGIVNQAIVGGAQFSMQGRPTLTSLVSAIVNEQTVDVGNGGILAGVPRNGSNGIAGFLAAVATQQSTRLLSTPSIMTLNNKEAEIVVAQNVPFVTGSFTSTGSGSNPENPFQTVERQDVGLTLAVTPQINADRTVKMLINQEVSNLTRTTSASGGEITSKRAISTTVLVRDGNVVMLGGLLENGSGSANQRVPGLSKIPLLGGLFRGKNASKNQRVLLVLLRPQVVATDAEARKLTRQISREAKAASQTIAPMDDGQYPRTPRGSFPFDGADLNQPFDAGFVDDIAQSRNYPPLPSRLRFNGN
ncbi:type II secretion system secretin GspD [Alisedimentitalea sp. MJ-SS2]|uniref:type II secretion system secretin GspD n=1 Tax=Aliisedimentitalea sp. MJ-SS2 TaxID=3049795 RepID=UPI002906A6BF|nr:type II secretion system secretin GspD [Alisedimentitalea sp. MJ-SS2]MDU8925820.1 type II secretion system secretin GspD [Alisedimentitalea sp. MJ-SS2]